MDLNPLPKELAPLVHQQFVGSILDSNLLDRILAEYEIDLLFHLAALLSTRYKIARPRLTESTSKAPSPCWNSPSTRGNRTGRPVLFLYPSSIAAYGMPSLEEKAAGGKVHEDLFCTPTTIYGCTKLYCEQLGRYYSKYYKQLAAETQSGKVDFRCIRFPGLISAFTVPSGGTSDYASEMIHAAARGTPYACFVRPDTRIPFMAMPDSIDALFKLAAAPRERLTRTVYNIGAFNPSAAEIQAIVQAAFPKAEITTHVDVKRQGIVDSWPADVDDRTAHRDWGLAPLFNLKRASRKMSFPLSASAIESSNSRAPGT